MYFAEAVNHLPIWANALICLVIGGGVVPAIQLAIRRRYGVESLMVNNEVAGFKYAVLGVVYAVLLVFIMVAVWDEFRDAKSDTAQEARALLDLYRLSLGFDDGSRVALRDSILHYANAVVHDEWPALARGEASPVADAALKQLFERVMVAVQSGHFLEAIRQPAIGLVIEIADCRRSRLDFADGVIPRVLWGVILIGGIATLSFTWFFGSNNARAQAGMTAMLSVMVLSVIFVSAMLDRPFTGEVSVSPKPFEQTIRDLHSPLAAPATRP